MMLPAIAPIRIHAYTATTAAGAGCGSLLSALREHRSALRLNEFTEHPLVTWIGRVDGLESCSVPATLAALDCRNNRLAWLGLNQDGFLDAVLAARERFGAARVAVVIGTSTSSIGATEGAYARVDADGRFPVDRREARVHTPHSQTMFVQRVLGLSGPCLTVSTACSSSAKVFASAERLLRLGLVDAAVVGGVDTLCGSVLFGFNALELVSSRPCRPFDADRDGLSLGEAAGYALLLRDGDAPLDDPMLLGYGESSDAHHMSSPHPEGLGAEAALDDALARADITIDQVDYVNLHGTASRKNDEVEAMLLARRFPAGVHASSTKGITGHTLGAAGIVEAVICLLAIEHGLRPGTVNSVQLDPVCGPQLRLAPDRGPVEHALSHSFGFGGNNCALLFGRGAR